MRNETLSTFGNFWSRVVLIHFQQTNSNVWIDITSQSSHISSVFLKICQIVGACVWKSDNTGPPAAGRGVSDTIPASRPSVLISNLASDYVHAHFRTSIQLNLNTRHWFFQKDFYKINLSSLLKLDYPINFTINNIWASSI